MARIQWITPARAAEEMSRRAGYKIAPADIQQLRRTKKVTHIKKINGNLSLYDLAEIQSLPVIKKRNPIPIETNFNEFSKTDENSLKNP